MRVLKEIRIRSCVIAFLGSAVQAFGLYNVHSLSHVTEGGVLGATLLLEHWLHISPSVSGFILNVICYLIGWKTLGKLFIAYSFAASVGFSVTYRICEQFDPLWPQIAQMPFLAAVAGALFIGIGVGICIRSGGATSGDDALAMSISHRTNIPIQKIYLVSDLAVLGLSLSYIPVKRIAFSLLTVVLSGQIIGWIQKIPVKGEKT